MTGASPTAGNSLQRYGVIAIALSVSALAFWVWLAPLHGAVIAMGVVKAATSRKLVQHMEGGVIKRIHVRNGDAAVRGQPLIEIEDVKIDANLQMLREMFVFEAIKQDRLEAEQSLSSAFASGPQRYASFDPANIEKAYNRELRIFRVRRSLLDDQLASLRRQIEAIDKEQTALKEQSAASRTAADLAKEELRINSELVRDGFISRARLLTLERSVAELAAKRGEHDAMAAQAEQRRSELHLRMSSLRIDYQRIAAEELKESNARLVQLREQIRTAEDTAQRKVVVAPVSGKVVNLRHNAPGEVALPREPIMEIVPDDEALLVEAKVEVDAIRHLKAGQRTELRFTTFNSRVTPLVDGKLIYVSPDAVSDPDGVPRYVIHAAPDMTSLASAGIESLKSGMGAEVFVITEGRSTIDYMLAPITESLRRTLREP